MNLGIFKADTPYMLKDAYILVNLQFSKYFWLVSLQPTKHFGLEPPEA